MPTLHILEPHPSLPSTHTHYLPSGRGGAGNIHSYHKSQLTSGPNATGPAFAYTSASGVVPGASATSSSHPDLSRSSRSARTSRSPPPNALTSSSTTQPDARVQSPRVRLTGRGGLGNALPKHVHAPYDLEAELAAAEQRETAREERRRMSSLALAPTMTMSSVLGGRRGSSVCRIGRGGAGNVVDEDEEVERVRREARLEGRGSVVSDGSFGSVGSGSGRGWGRRLSRMWSRE